jgi:hypothetical protein
MNGKKQLATVQPIQEDENEYVVTPVDTLNVKKQHAGSVSSQSQNENFK